MFRGSIPVDTQKILHELAKAWPVKQVYVGASGNFTIERALHNLKRFEIHSNDAGVYSSSIGAYFASEDFPVKVKAEYQERWGWLDAYLEDPITRLPAILLSVRILDGHDKDGPYFDRLRKGYKDAWGELMGKTGARLNDLQDDNFFLASYTQADLLSFIATVPAKAGFVSCPHYKADADPLLANLEDVFDYPSIPAVALTEDGLIELAEKCAKREFWSLILRGKLPDEFESYLVGKVLTSVRGYPLYIYANEGSPRIVIPAQHTEPVLIPRLAEGDVISPEDHIALVELSAPQFNALRAKYMDGGYIAPAAPGFSFGVLLEGKLIGTYSLSKDGTKSFILQPTEMYLLSDFPVAPTSYKHLAKLIVYAAISNEGKLLAERAGRRRIRSLVTTAFSNHHESMKYRGVLKQQSKKENPDYEVDPHAKQFVLNYEGTFGQWSLKEGLTRWHKKYGKVLNG